jgi:hypothetical protein
MSGPDLDTVPATTRASPWPDRLRRVTLAALWWLIAAPQISRLAGPEIASAALLVVVLVAAAIVVVTFAALYAAGAPNNDRVLALDAAVEALLRGGSPYAATNAAGHATTELPGALLLAVPFHLLGGAVLQNLFWLVLLMLRLPRWFPEARGAAAAAVLVLTNPGLMADILGGGDVVVDAVVLVFAVDGLMATVDKRSAPGVAGAVILLALALSMHPVSWVVLPVVAVALGRRRSGVLAAGTTALTAAILFAFYARDPAHFTPLGLLQQLDLLPRVFWALPLLSLAAAGLVVGRPTPRVVLTACGSALAIVLVPPLLWGVAIAGFNYSLPFATPVLLFLAAGWGAPLSRGEVRYP